MPDLVPPTGFRRAFYRSTAARVLLTVAAVLGIFNGVLNLALAIFIPVWAAILVIVWTMPLAVIDQQGIKPRPFRARVGWSDIAATDLRTRGGSSSVELRLVDGRTIRTAIPGREHAWISSLFGLSALPPPNPRDRVPDA